MNDQDTTTEYHVVDNIEGAKVLAGNNGAHGLPDYAHTHNSIYLKKDYNGSFREMRIYDSETGRVMLEIAYHKEPYLTDKSLNIKTLHYHIYDEQLHHGKAIKLEKGDPIYEKYKKILEAFGL